MCKMMSHWMPHNITTYKHTYHLGGGRTPILEVCWEHLLDWPPYLHLSLLVGSIFKPSKISLIPIFCRWNTFFSIMYHFWDNVSYSCKMLAPQSATHARFNLIVHDFITSIYGYSTLLLSSLFTSQVDSIFCMIRSQSVQLFIMCWTTLPNV